ncbi:MAG: hypothetical protein IPJ65_22925 [Archangiaceae bacterium]|nr:hypothetical protein [Archangiaceae bacterium]
MTTPISDRRNTPRTAPRLRSPSRAEARVTALVERDGWPRGAAVGSPLIPSSAVLKTATGNFTADDLLDLIARHAAKETQRPRPRAVEWFMTLPDDGMMTRREDAKRKRCNLVYEVARSIGATYEQIVDFIELQQGPRQLPEWMTAQAPAFGVVGDGPQADFFREIAARTVPALPSIASFTPSADDEQRGREQALYAPIKTMYQNVEFSRYSSPKRVAEDLTPPDPTRPLSEAQLSSTALEFDVKPTDLMAYFEGALPVLTDRRGREVDRSRAELERSTRIDFRRQLPHDSLVKVAALDLGVWPEDLVAFLRGERGELSSTSGPIDADAARAHISWLGTEYAPPLRREETWTQAVALAEKILARGELAQRPHLATMFEDGFHADLADVTAYLAGRPVVEGQPRWVTQPEAGGIGLTRASVGRELERWARLPGFEFQRGTFIDRYLAGDVPIDVVEKALSAMGVAPGSSDERDFKAFLTGAEVDSPRVSHQYLWQKAALAMGQSTYAPPVDDRELPVLWK